MLPSLVMRRVMSGANSGPMTQVEVDLVAVVDADPLDLRRVPFTSPR